MVQLVWFSDNLYRDSYRVFRIPYFAVETQNSDFMFVISSFFNSLLVGWVENPPELKKENPPYKCPNSHFDPESSSLAYSQHFYVNTHFCISQLT